ncbi:MAG: hypothetical protein GC152_03085 [Alphaproteobacteria bacterium]|nr:hypothetical protein [Alphaproteobacteria bacterium]
MRFNGVSVVSGLFLGLSVPGAAHAALMFQIERISDTVASITAIGALEVETSRILFEDLTSIGDEGVDMYAGSFLLGGQAPSSVFTPAQTTDYAVNLVDAAPVGSTVSGELVATLDAETFAPVGATGDVKDQTGDVTIGAYEVVAPNQAKAAVVPAPGAALLILTAFAGFGLARRFGGRN